MQQDITRYLREGISQVPGNTPGATPRDGQPDRPDSKLTPPGQVSAEPTRTGAYLIRIGRAHSEKRFQLSRNEAAELVRVLTRDVLTAAEIAR